MARINYSTGAGICNGFFFESVADHHPILLGPQLWEGAHSSLPTSHTLRRPLTRSPDLDLTNLAFVRDFA